MTKRKLILLGLLILVVIFISKFMPHMTIAGNNVIGDLIPKK